MPLSRPFELVALAPSASEDLSIAVAARGAGGLGIVDLEHVTEPAAVGRQMRRLAAYPDLRFGLKLDGRAPECLDLVAAEATSALHTVVVTAGPEPALVELAGRLRARGVRLVVSVSCAEDAALALTLDADALIAKGHEAGGWVGEETTFVLLQRLLAGTTKPVWAHGGIGPRVAAACYAAGAAGVVLDGQLLLLEESRLSATLRAAVERMDGGDTVVLGSELGAPCRVYSRPRLEALEVLRARATALDDGRAVADARLAWREAVRARVGWGDPDRQVWPLGQDAALAGVFARRYRNVAGTFAGLRQAVREHCLTARRLRPLDEGGSLARSHGTRYPILQGPMTRVSDTAAFAGCVADAGALPFLALALSRGPETRVLLEDTRRRLGDRPWGVGILGFVPLDLRQEQLEAIAAVRPPFALIAGGRPDQALALEQQGIPTYLHVPSPGLLGMFLDAGARRFVFEGRECGGHVGPRSSFVLWELMIDVLLDKVAPGPEAESYHAVFAGGIHDARSAAMVATLAAPLAERGIRVGVLLGTAYLFTEEAVATGAIGPSFQDEALRCARTVLLETGPGHSTRCADTAFGQAFIQERRRLAADPAVSPDEARQALEELNLGRLRIASKGIARNPGHEADAGAPRFIQLPAEAQRAQGMFMIGQVAALRDRVTTVAELHRTVSVGATEWLQQVEAPGRAEPVRPAARPADVAIIGMATVLPKAPDLRSYWSNILGKVDAITEVPPERWDWRRYYDPDPKARDKVYSKWGGFIDPMPFDPMAYGMPPSTLRSIEPLQLLTLDVVRAALADAGYEGRPFPRDRTGVVMGVGGGSGDLGQQYAVRSNLPAYVGEDAEILARLPEWTEDSFAGILLNVVAGRVANRFDLGGVNYTVDAACASSLAAVYLAVRELEAGTADMMIVGGADTVQNPFAYLCFSKTQALSPRGRCRTFDADADGIAISEGIAVLVLKRLEDAERDGDRIYAVIKSVAGSSDGRDRGLTAPRPEGQMRALDRAYAAAGISPATLGLVEAHGTGTVAGDQAEVESLTRVLEAAGAGPASCAIGSVKSMIGHTKCTAGVAGLVKVAMALRHRVLPPTLHVERPNPKAFRPASPLYVNSETRPWVARIDGTPRRSAVSAFGFGGTNFHVVLEEHAGSTPAAAGGAWPAELCVFTGPTPAALAEALDGLERQLAAGATPVLRDLAYSLWQRARSGRQRGESAVTLAVVASALDDLRQKLAQAREALGAGRSALEDPRGVCYAAMPLGAAGLVAFLFPGQGSQHVDMLRDLAVHFPEVGDAFARADRVLSDRFPQGLSGHVFPPPAFSEADAQARQEALTRTNVAQPALGAAEVGLMALLGALGVEPSLVAGHSYGEYVALHAAGVMDEAALFALSEARGRAIIETAGPELGTMLAVQADEGRTRQALEGLADVWVANINAPDQTILSGTRRSLDEARGRLEGQGLQVRPIAVSCGFHSPLVARARDALATRLGEASLRPPRLPVFANTTGAPYPEDAAGVTAILADQLVSPVRFAEQVERMYAAGARLFVEVGPRSVLSSLVRANLGSRPHQAVSPGATGRPGLVALQWTLAQLAAHGVPVELDRLFEGRGARELDLHDLLVCTRPEPLPATAWMVNGGRAWPATEPAPLPPTPPVRALPLTTGPAPSLLSVATNGHDAAHAVRPVAPGVAPVTALSGGEAGGEGAAEVMAEFQRLMARFLDTQRNIMLAYLGGAPVAAAPAPIGPAPVAETATPARPVAEPAPAVTGVGEPAPAAAPSASPALPDRDRLTEGLVKLVSERTGYPPAMLALDLNMEADLGIDSIKRVEILGAFQRALVASPPADLMERLAGAKTLGQILDVVSAVGPGATPPEPAVLAPAAVESTPGDDAEVPRWLLAPVDAPLSAPTLPLALPGPVLITDDGRGVARALAGALEAAGLVPVLLRHEMSAVVDRDGHGADLTSVAEIERVVAAVRETHGAPAGLVHLLPLRPRVPFEDLDLAGWGRDLALDLESLFHLSRALSGDIKRAAAASPAFVLAVTGLGGAFASSGASGDVVPSHGGVAGFMKTLALEWPAVRATVVDVDPHLDPEVIARQVLAEAGAADGLAEVGYAAGRRIALRPRAASFLPATEDVMLMDGSWVVLVTGGARGITAEVVRELAERYKPTLILAGRSAPPAGEESTDTAGLTGQPLRLALIGRLAQDGSPPRPSQVEQAYRRLVQDREIRATLRRAREAGASVHYHQVDARDEGALSALLDQLYATHGRIDAVIHGAGVIEDRLLEEKETESFRRVVGTKLDGAFVLARRLRPESTRLLVFFSSVAARFGNRGQADYAAANEVLNKLAVRLDRAWPTRVVALGWGPWGKAGMVSAEVERQFLERGVEIIPPAAGRRACEEEMRRGCKGEPEVILGGGRWQTAPPATPAAAPEAILLPLLNGSAPSRDPSGTLELIRQLDPSHDLYLDHHRLDGKPVFPAAMALELMAETVQRGWPDWRVVGIRSLRVLRGIVLDDGPRAVRVLARPESRSAGAGGFAVHVEIFESGGQGPASYRATVDLASRLPEGSVSSPATGLVEPFPMSVSEAYERWLFHGPAFQGITSIEGISAERISAVLRPSAPEHLVRAATGDWLIDPVLVDSAFQLAILWVRAHHDVTPLPSRLGAYRRLGIASGAPLRCHLSARASDGGAVLTTQVAFVERDGRAVGALEDMEFTCSRSLNRLGGSAARQNWR